MELEECFKKGMIKRARKDIDLILSLKEMSDSKETAVRTANINETTISAYVSLAYDSLREILEAVCISKEYKVLSHICAGKLLKDIIPSFPLIRFDRVRWIRNNINYYGNKVSLREGKTVINEIFNMKKKMMNYLKSLEPPG